jgi:hypothetical protein
MCKHDWPGSSCPDCRREAEEAGRPKVTISNFPVGKYVDKRLDTNALLRLLLDSVDYTGGACRPNEMIGAVLPKSLLEKCKESVKSKPPSDQQSSQSPVINPWQREPDDRKLKLLGKMVEELGELSQSAARCIIQGTEKSHPVSAKPNLEWLAEEIADALATIHMVVEECKLTPRFIEERMASKQAGFRLWLNNM